MVLSLLRTSDCSVHLLILVAGVKLIVRERSRPAFAITSGLVGDERFDVMRMILRELGASVLSYPGCFAQTKGAR